VKKNRSCITIEKEGRNSKIIKKRMDNLKNALDIDKIHHLFKYAYCNNYDSFEKSIKTLKI
jgi:hypothetical protein